MNTEKFKIKVGFVEGLGEVVESEIKLNTAHDILDKKSAHIYIDYLSDNKNIFELKSIANISLVFSGEKINPKYISQHKSILKDLVDEVLTYSKDNFKTFKISCAGQDSQEVKSIMMFVEDEYKFTENGEADLKINIYKNNTEWEIAIQLTKRPLSFRKYKLDNMSGAMNPNIAYALNYFCELENKKTYLNAFSGSCTLLIEAGLEYKNLENLVGFDNDKEHLTFGYHNIKEAGLIKKIKLLEQDINENPNLGNFDAIVADLPFGMAISKNKNLNIIYKNFIDFCDRSLNDNGVVGVYTTQSDLFLDVISNHKWKKIKEIKLKLVTNVDSYLYPSIFILKKK